MDNKKIRQALFDLQHEIDQLSGRIDDLIKMIPPDAGSNSNAPFRMPDMIRQARALLGSGLSTWEVAEKMASWNGASKWGMYYLIAGEKSKKDAQIRYARAYLIRALSDSGFSFSEIAPIAGCSRQRCQQILKMDLV